MQLFAITKRIPKNIPAPIPRQDSQVNKPFNNTVHFVCLVYTREKEKKINSRKMLSIWFYSPKDEDLGQGPPCKTMHST